MWSWRAKFQTVSVLAAILLARPAAGQVGANYFVTDPANLYDWRAALLNPSIGAYQTGAVEFGFKVFQLGFADAGATLFKSGYAVLNLPRRLPANLTFGVQTQAFVTPLLRDTRFQLTLSRAFFQVFSLGVGVGMLGFSYSTDSFDLVDPDDPVFSGGTSRWQPDLSLGLTIVPMSSLVLGVSVRHLNQPAVSLRDNSVRLEPTISVGLAFNFGSLGLHSGGTQLHKGGRPNGFLQLHSDNIGQLQVGYQNEAAWLRGRLRVAGPVSVGYGLSYPLGELQGATKGSHEAFLAYEFDRLKGMPDLLSPPQGPPPFKPAMPRIDLTPQFMALADERTVDIYAKRLVREIARDIDAKVLARIADLQVASIDTSFVERVFPFELEKAVPSDSAKKFRDKYSDRYLASLRRLREDLSSNPADVVIIAPESQQHRAMALGEYFREVLRDTEAGVTLSQARFLSDLDSLRQDAQPKVADLKPVEEIVLLRPDTVRFTIYPISANNTPLEWTLMVETKEGELVFQHDGLTAEVTTVAWDWRDRNGSVISPGYYKYYVQWYDENGQLRVSPSQLLYARKLQRNIHVKITRKYDSSDTAFDKIGIILNK